MTEAEWLTAADAGAMVRFAASGLSARRERLLSCALARQVWDRLPDPRSRRAVEIAERFADGEATGRQLLLASRKAERVGADMSAWPPGTHRIMEACAAALCASRVRGAVCNVCEVLHPVFAGNEQGRRGLADMVREVVGNPFRPVTFHASWLTSTVVTLARQMYDSRDFSAMPILADALMDGGCSDEQVLTHCRGEGPHVRGCFVVDAILGRA
jgi:hypothetical protein